LKHKLRVKTKKQNGLALAGGIYRCSFTASRIYVSPLQNYARPAKAQGVK
jgi:hypothetical protein